MTIARGSRIGTYEVRALLGSGGMGDVYRALDTNLQREVALKILPAAFASDPERCARFEREARLLASLNHQNIAQIYGFENTASGRALALELVEGGTLADRLALGAMPLAEALAVARQLVDALAAAHDHGVVHRDLKPSNICVRPDGTVKVLDFGLAKAVEDGAPAAAANSRTTDVNVVLGTTAYVCPERLRGERGQALRYLGVRLRLARDADRQARVRRRRSSRDHGGDSARRARLERTAERYARVAPHAARELPRERSCASAPRHRRRSAAARRGAPRRTDARAPAERGDRLAGVGRSGGNRSGDRARRIRTVAR